MSKTALPRALLVVSLCALLGFGCSSFNPFRWPPKLISERTWHITIHKPTPAPPADPKEPRTQ
jgi:hypothetical protein